MKSLFIRNRVYVQNVASVVVLKGIAVILSFVMTPMYLNYFSEREILGVWYAILSILTWILTFDLGIGNGLRNGLAFAVAKSDVRKGKELISSAYIALGGISVALMITLLFVIPAVNWKDALNSSLDDFTLSSVITVLLVGLILQFFLRIVTSVLYAVRKIAIANLLPILTNIFILVFLLIPPKGSDHDRFITLAYVHSIATLVPLIGATLYVFMHPLRAYLPSLKYYSRTASKQVISVGGAFFLIQVSLLVINSTNQVLINNYFGGEAVVQYTVYYRLFYISVMMFALITQPTWSEITIKFAESNIHWIKTAYKMLVRISLVLILLSIGIALLLPTIFQLWLGPTTEIVANRIVGLFFVLWVGVELLVMASTCIANGMSQLRTQAIATTIAAVLKIPVTLLVMSMWAGWPSVVLAHSLILLPIVLFQNIALRKYFN